MCRRCRLCLELLQWDRETGEIRYLSCGLWLTLAVAVALSQAQNTWWMVQLGASEALPDLSVQPISPWFLYTGSWTAFGAWSTPPHFHFLNSAGNGIWVTLLTSGLLLS